MNQALANDGHATATEPDVNLLLIRRKEDEIASLLAQADAEAQERIEAARRRAEELVEGADALGRAEADERTDAASQDSERRAEEERARAAAELQALSATVQASHQQVVAAMKERLLLM